METSCAAKRESLCHYDVCTLRKQGNRLQVSLMLTQRVSGRVQAEHIASLGSVDVAVSVRERLAFWAKLPERLARLGNRFGPNDQAKIYAAINARIPMVTPDEQRKIQVENARDDERFWDVMRDISASTAEDHKRVIVSSEAKLKQHDRAAGAALRMSRLPGAGSLSRRSGP
jgi:hypothetical protein